MFIENKKTMHKTLTILLFLLLFLAACCPVRYPQVLLEADSLASACPDSAVALLRGLQAEMAGERKAVQIYYRLLCVKAQDKAYIPHTSDSAVQAVLRYYEGHRDRRHLPEAYYYAGRVASDLGDAPQALDYFDKALEAMPRDGMLPLRSKVLSQMGTLFYRQGMYPEALEMYKGSLKSDSVLGDSVGIIANRLNMSLSYKSLGKQDSMRIFALSAHLLNRNMQRPPHTGDIENRLAWAYLCEQQYDSARLFLREALQNSNDRNKDAIYTTAGLFHQALGNSDSAVWYYQHLLHETSIYVRQVAYGNLAQLALAQNNPQKALHYLYEHNLCADSIQKITNTEGIRKVYALYNYQLREKENARLRAVNERNARGTTYLIITAGILSVMVVFYIRRRRKTWDSRIKAITKLKDEIYQRSEQYIHNNEIKIQQLSNLLQDKEKDLQESEATRQRLERQLKILQNVNQQINLEKDSRESAEYLLYHSEIYTRFRQRLKADGSKSRLTQQEWKCLQEQIDQCYNGFTSKLNGAYQLDDRELHICLLIKLQFSYTEIGKLVNLSLSGINSVRSRLYQKVFGIKGNAKDWDTFILSL